MAIRLTKARLLVSLGGILAVTACDALEEDPAATPAPHETREAGVERVVDGDTIIVDLAGERRRVRLLNIDAPEATDPDRPAECLGPEATAFVEGLLPPGTEVHLVYDIEVADQYGRDLAGVFRDELFVNAEIARHGLAEAVYFPPNDRFLDDVEAAVAEARAARRGLFDPSIPCTTAR